LDVLEKISTRETHTNTLSIFFWCYQFRWMPPVHGKCRGSHKPLSSFEILI